MAKRRAQNPPPLSTAQKLPPENPRPRTAAQRAADARRRQIAHDEAQVRLRVQRRLQVDALTQLFAISSERRADFMAMHSRELDQQGAPQLKGSFVRYLDSELALSPRAAWTKLQKEYKDIAFILKLCLFAQDPLSMKAAARVLTCHCATISRKLWQGIDLLSTWTGMQLAIDPAVTKDADEQEQSMPTTALGAAEVA